MRLPLVSTTLVELLNFRRGRHRGFLFLLKRFQIVDSFIFHVTFLKNPCVFPRSQYYSYTYVKQGKEHLRLNHMNESGTTADYGPLDFHSGNGNTALLDPGRQTLILSNFFGMKKTCSEGYWEIRTLSPQAEH